jgi:hypothetical protein
VDGLWAGGVDWWHRETPLPQLASAQHTCCKLRIHINQDCVLLDVTGHEQRPPCSISALYDEVVARGPPAEDDMSMWAQMTRIKV